MDGDIAKLILAIVQDEDVLGLNEALIQAGFPGPTRINSAGGFLKQGNVTLFLGVAASLVPQVLRLIAENCHTRSQYINPLPPMVEASDLNLSYPIEVQVGGATVLILDVERYERF